MSDKNLVVLEKILEEMSIAQSLLGSHDVESFMDDVYVTVADEFPSIAGDIRLICEKADQPG